MLSSACLKLSVTGLTTQVNDAFLKIEFHKKDFTETQATRLKFSCSPQMQNACRKENL